MAGGGRKKIKRLHNHKSNMLQKKKRKKTAATGTGHGATKTNFAYIQRGKEMEEIHRRQKQLDEKYNPKSQLEQIIGMSEEQIEEVERRKDQHHTTPMNTYNALVSELKAYNNDGNSDGGDDEYSDSNDDREEDLQDDSMSKDGAENEEEEHEEEDEPDEDGMAILTRKEQNSKICAQATVTAHDDAYRQHLEFELPVDNADILLNSVKYKDVHLKWPELQQVNLRIPLEGSESENVMAPWAKPLKEPLRVSSPQDMVDIHISPAIAERVTSLPLSGYQNEFLSLFNNYYDVYYANRALKQGEELRAMYCLHAVNHMKKARTRIVRNNAKLAAQKEASKGAAALALEEYRDQGLVRPRVLILLPFRQAALQVVNLFKQYYIKESASNKKKQENVINYTRFLDEYSGQTLHFPKTNPKPSDYELTFAGNIDDNFRLGLSLTKSSIKLYTDFFMSDIILASPLGLKMMENENYDFLNSIELLIVDQMDVLYAQNWENFLYVLEHLHGQPRSLQNTDFQRVRNWNLNGMARFYRQSLLFSMQDLPEFRSCFNAYCNNYRGKALISNPQQDATQTEMRNIIVQNIPQVFHRIDITQLDTLADERFAYFVNEILPKFKGPSYAHCLIYVPSYFDYVRLRNYFQEKTLSFVQICEYTEDAKISRARDIFFHSGVQFLLYSERSHFFRRTRLKGIRHLIMYQLPSWSKFYSELINLMHESNQNPRDELAGSMSITALYTKYDMLRLTRILGSKDAEKLIKKRKRVHAYLIE